MKSELLLLSNLVSSTIKWKKVDSHIGRKIFTPDKPPKGNPLAWRLNEAMDELANTQCRKDVTEGKKQVEYFFLDSVAMVEVDNSMVYRMAHESGRRTQCNY